KGRGFLGCTPVGCISPEASLSLCPRVGEQRLLSVFSGLHGVPTSLSNDGLGFRLSWLGVLSFTGQTPCPNRRLRVSQNCLYGSTYSKNWLYWQSVIALRRCEIHPLPEVRGLLSQVDKTGHSPHRTERLAGKNEFQRGRGHYVRISHL